MDIWVEMFYCVSLEQTVTVSSDYNFVKGQ